MSDDSVTPDGGSPVVQRRLKRTKASTEIMVAAKQHLREGSYGKALQLLKAIEENEPEATFLLGVVYFDGLGIVEDMASGIQCMRKVTEMCNLQPHEEALQSFSFYNLGMLYFRGVGLLKDDDEVLRHWLHAANMSPHPKTGKVYPGTLKAQTALGMFFSHPDSHDLEKSFYWHTKAYANGSVESEGVLGVMHMYGYGILEDQAKAYKYLMHASSRGNVYAQGYLTALYYNKQLYDRAVDMGKMMSRYDDLDTLSRTTGSEIENVQRGVAVGCFYLALCCQYGEGIQKDKAMAKHLIQRAVHLCPTLVVDLHVKAILGIK